MARPRFFNARPELQAAILGAAVRELATKGYEGASLNRILAAAKLSKGAFYYYFDDKADLAATVVHKAYDDIVVSTGGLEISRDAGEFWATVHRFQRESIDTVERSPDTGEAVARIAVAAQRDPKLAALLAPTFDAASALGLRAWKRGQTIGAVRRDVDAAVLLALVQAIKETLIRVYLPPRHPVRAKDVDRLAAVVLDMIRRISEPAKPKRRR